jgi:hypothetical protein
MTPKQILDSFSETLVRDERILSPQERALVATLLQHARAANGQSPQTQEAVRAVIASAIGETVAQRAFAVLGGSIVERILEGSTLPQADSAIARTGHLCWAASAHGPTTPGRVADTAAEIRRQDRNPHSAPQPPSLPLRRMGEPDPPSVTAAAGAGRSSPAESAAASEPADGRTGSAVRTAAPGAGGSSSAQSAAASGPADGRAGSAIGTAATGTGGSRASDGTRSTEPPHSHDRGF